MKKAAKLTAPARKALCRALAFASELGSSYIGSEHLLVGLAEEGSASGLLAESGLTPGKLSGLVRASAEAGAAGELPVQGPDETARRILARASLSAGRREMASVASEDILSGLLRERGCTALKILRACGADPDALIKRLESGRR